MTLVFGAIPPIAIVFALPFLLPSVPAEKVDLIKWFFSCPFPPLRFSLLLNVPAEKVDLINNQMVFSPLPFSSLAFFFLPSVPAEKVDLINNQMIFALFLPCLFSLFPSAPAENVDDDCHVWNLSYIREETKMKKSRATLKSSKLFSGATPNQYHHKHLNVTRTCNTSIVTKLPT